MRRHTDADGGVDAPGEVLDHDDTLILPFMRCHPALTPASAIALTLRAVGGLTTAEIASAFLVSEATMAQRITRAKQRIKASSAAFRMPTQHEQAARLRSVLHVLYLIFNEGYATSTGRELHRTELSDEAIRLTRMLRQMRPGDATGELITLAAQDRTLWDQALIAEGIALINRGIGSGAVGEYQIQAAIAAIHDRARRAGDTDWRQILALNGLLEQMTRSPIVSLNKAVAAAMVDGAVAGLAMLDAVDERLSGHYRVDTVRAHLLEMAGDKKAAMAHYRAAAGRTTSLPERRYLTKQAARLKMYDASGRGSTH